MTNLSKFALGSAMVAALVAQPGLAQTAARKPAVAAPVAAAPRGTVVTGIGVADLQAAVANTNAYKAAVQLRKQQYKPIYDQAQNRLNQLEAQLKPLADQFNADRAAKKPDAVLQAEYDAIQKAQAQGEAEIKQILVPANTSDQYVIEQITDKLPQAVQNVMGRRGLTMLLNPDAVILSAQPYDVTGAVVAELNALVPSAQINPPPGWQPRQVREQQAQQQQQAAGTAPAVVPKPATTAPKPAGPQPEGR
jgi:Skp family chaperone for outer membrane proteins